MQLSFFILLPSPFGEGFGGEAFILHSKRSDYSSFIILLPSPFGEGLGGEAFILHLIIWSFP